MTADHAQLVDAWVRAEASLIGATLILYDDRHVDEILGQVPPAAFHRGEHRKIWEALAAARDDGQPADTASVVDVLDKRGLLDGHEPGWLADLTASIPSAAGVSRAAQLVLEQARRRDLHTTGMRLASTAHDRTVDIDDLVGTTVDELLGQAGRTGDGIIRVDDVATEVLDRREHGIITRGVSTGWFDVDRLYRVVPGNLTILAGIPGHGKSTWLDSLLVNLAERHGWRTMQFSPESAPIAEHVDELVTRRVGRKATLLEVQAALGWVHEHFAWVDHDSHTTVSQILTAVRAEHARRPVNSFVIDPWTELDVTRQRNEREDEYIRREVTRIRQFARRHDLHAFLVVHPKNIDANRDGTYPIPRASDLHGGSVWRKQADALVVIWRDEGGVNRSDDIAEVVVQKIRRQPGDGRLGRTSLRFDMHTHTYAQISPLDGGTPA
ncbi:DnaB-like helicase N-terminal domain-containing protein [Euzebya sp.]|uniref:DnaB-like helicase N-terminal domain-containing protein n=1 Tax=Euzebya sp. TaxID=1971409 RepID=UPI00351359BF